VNGQQDPPTGADRRSPLFGALLLLVLLLLPALLLSGCAGSSDSGTTTGPAPGAATSSSEASGGDGSSITDSAQSQEEIARRVASAVEASVVEVRAVVSSSALSRQFASGGGVVYRADGIVVTNDHVIAGGGEEVLGELVVILSSGEELSAKLVGREPAADVAVIRVDREGLEPATFIQDLSQVQQGQTVVAIGSRSLEENVTIGSVTRVLRGVRSATLNRLEALIQTDAPVQQGNSGGPLVDLEGRVVGIVLAETRGVQGAERGLGMAIPAPTVAEVTEGLLAGAL